MNPVIDKSRSGPERKSSGQGLASWWKTRLRTFLTASGAILPATARSQAEDLLNSARGQLATIMEIGMWVLLAAGYVAAAYMIITGAIRLFQDRESGVGRFATGVLVAILMVILMTFFVTAGQEEIENIRSG